MKLWTMTIAALFFCFLGCAALTGCGGTAIETEPCAGSGDGGGSPDAYPCAISSSLICDECKDQPDGAVCGVWGVCTKTAVVPGPLCLDPCDHLANNVECAPHRHCQQVTEGKPLSLCIPGEGVKG